MRRRIITVALLSSALILISLGIISNFSIQKEIDHSLQRNLHLAETTARYVDHLLQVNLARLYDVSLSRRIDLGDADWEPEKNALQTAYQYSIFADGLFILDSQARIVLSFPPTQVNERDLRGIPDVRRAFEEDKPFFTGIHILSETQRRAMFAFAPLKDKSGKTAGVIGGVIDPTSPFLRSSIQALPEDEETIIELIDAQGTVIASSDPSRVFSCADKSRFLGDLITSRQSDVLRCHRCHVPEEQTQPTVEPTADILAFAPLLEAPWGVAVRAAESHVFATSDYLRLGFTVLALILGGSALVLGIAVSRSIVRPIRELTQAAVQITRGELNEPIHVHSRDEIEALGQSLETMRVRLAQSLDSLREANLELERRVEERTQQLVVSRRRLSLLLGKVISAQEDERKRIARELHDETLQNAAALGLSLDIAALSLQEGKLTPAKLLDLKSTVDQLIDSMNALIQDLRPPMLDDLGLESALRWLLNSRLEERQVQYSLHLSEEFKKFLESLRQSGNSELIELNIFRIVQEATNNIARHSCAKTATVTLFSRQGRIVAQIEDDGVGFDAETIMRRRAEPRGDAYGLLGIRERATLLGGSLEIVSSPGEGTTLQIEIPTSHFQEIEAS